MKIGILTFHAAQNYGAVLQCRCLYEVLRGLGHEVHVLDYRPAFLTEPYKLWKNAYLKHPLPLLKVAWKLTGALRRRRGFADFEKTFSPVPCRTEGFDAIVFGSDQIWNTSLTNGDLTFFGKGFNGKKIAYGASDGGEIEFSDEIKDLLNSFEYITCRETSLAEKIKKLGVTVPVSAVSDPVFFLSKEDWLKIAVLPKERNYVLAYKISDRPDFDEQTEKLGEQLGKKVIQIVYVKSLRKLFYKKQHFAESISPEQFVGYFANADYVITTSFHGTAFSILFEKPFYVLSFKKRSERITELLNKYNFENRYIDSL